MQSTGMRCPPIETAPQRPCGRSEEPLVAGAAAPLASGTVSPGIAGTVMPAITTQPFGGVAGAALALAGAFGAGAVSPGIAGSTMPP